MLVDKFVKSSFDSYEDFLKNYKLNIPKNFNFAFDVVDVMANETPDKKAIIWCDEAGSEKILTFSDIKKYSNKTANYFKSLGIRKGDFVMAMLKRRYEYWFCAMALHKIGAVLVPATHLLTPHDITYRVKMANIKMILAAADKRISDIVNTAKQELPQLNLLVSINGHVEGWHDYDSEIEKFSDVFERPTGKEAIKNDDISLMYFTSGTTGYPKMAYHDFTYPLGHILTARFWQNLDDSSIHLTVADTGWAKASWGKLYGQWLCGACIFVYDFERFHAKELIEKVAHYKVTSFCAPPTVYRHLIKEDISEYDLSNLRYAETAGEALNPEVFNQFKKMTGLEIKEGFGQTESVVFAANFPWITPKPGSMGKPSAGWNVQIVDAQNNICEPGQEGYLVIKTDKKHKPAGLFCGYYKNDDLTKDCWHDGYYNTGDMGYKDEDGYLWFVGRSDDVIKSSGYRIGPFEVESALMEHPSVLECSITGVPDKERGAVVKATIVLAKGYEPSQELVVQLQDYVKKATAPYKYPRIVEFVKELPKTISGKIRRVEIRERDKNKNC